MFFTVIMEQINSQKYCMCVEWGRFRKYKCVFVTNSTHYVFLMCPWKQRHFLKPIQIYKHSSLWLNLSQKLLSLYISPAATGTLYPQFRLNCFTNQIRHLWLILNKLDYVLGEPEPNSPCLLDNAAFFGPFALSAQRRQVLKDKGFPHLLHFPLSRQL